MRARALQNCFPHALPAPKWQVRALFTINQRSVHGPRSRAPRTLYNPRMHRRVHENVPGSRTTFAANAARPKVARRLAWAHNARVRGNFQLCGGPKVGNLLSSAIWPLRGFQDFRVHHRETLNTKPLNQFSVYCDNNHPSTETPPEARRLHHDEQKISRQQCALPGSARR